LRLLECLLRLGRARGNPPAEGGDLPIELAHPRLEGVAFDEGIDRVGLDVELRLLQPVLPALLGEEMARGDLRLLLHRVPAHLNDLHTVA